MAATTKIMSWFLRNVIAPNIFDINNAGFIVERFSDKKKEAYRREFFCAEEMLAQIEKKFVEKYGQKGHYALYRTGKEFGYNYAKVLQFPNKKTSSEKELKEFSGQLIPYIAAMWASDAQEVTNDPKKEIFSLKIWNYIVCSKNGIGHLIGDGGIAGICYAE